MGAIFQHRENRRCGTSGLGLVVPALLPVANRALSNAAQVSQGPITQAKAMLKVADLIRAQSSIHPNRYETPAAISPPRTAGGMCSAMSKMLIVDPTKTALNCA